MKLFDRILGWAGLRPRSERGALRNCGPALHVVILDGTMSSLRPGRETNAGLAYKLLCEIGQSQNLTVYYEAGLQWRDWASTWDVMTGKGINRQIKRAYGVLASRYRRGDRIMLIGYSRGAYAVRSLAGVIDRVGLLRHDMATVRHVRQAYRHYQAGGGPVAAEFAHVFCHPEVTIDAIGVWDTVKALGVRLPLVAERSGRTHEFHNHHLGHHVKNGFQALGLDETRVTYAPVMWETAPDWQGQLEQVWFRGNHGDVGGQVGGWSQARPLANIPLVWMLERLAGCGLNLPAGWQMRFIVDAGAPSSGTWNGWAMLFLHRRARAMGRDVSERLHQSVPQTHWARKYWVDQDAENTEAK